MTDRNYAITLDHAHGETYEAIARKYKINTSRAQQIYRATMARLDLPQTSPPHIIGLAIQKRVRGWPEQGTAEWLYQVIEAERAEDYRHWYYTGDGAV